MKFINDCYYDKRNKFRFLAQREMNWKQSRIILPHNAFDTTCFLSLFMLTKHEIFLWNRKTLKILVQDKIVQFDLDVYERT